ncbi:tumor necrosis factor receptor superfamily member 5 [Melanotaenia boesemani]|uniref:tumor necrosis factor receptor superfamily member 5 n=1 Tax=Melanotaenia boesemani TaxID=1250792 RepID=UPI001C03EB13|nr:tumor necrosis factor receptor superfamily member 5 [Melanotaenia boesemani]
MTCVEKNEDGCEYCPAGKYAQHKCNSTQQTKCIDCKPGTYTDSKNTLEKCLSCNVCIPSHRVHTVSNCTTSKDTVCECETGFFCSNDVCDHCQPLTKCPPGEGVKVKATRTTDTVCAKCEEGTYNNVTDYSSPCIAYNRCEEREGNTTTCGTYKSSCSWILPAGLWSGLVMTILIVTVVFILWRARRKSHRTENFRVPVTLVKIPLTPAVTPPDLSSHCQETCAIEDCKLPLFNPDNPTEVCSIKDSFDSSVPITPMKVSFSFVDSNHINGSGGYSKGNFFRLHSEPQEDEWCGAESPGIDQVSSMA